MPKQVNAEGIGVIDFPDDATDEDILAGLNDIAPAAAPETPDEAASKKSSRLSLELEAAREELGPVTKYLIAGQGIAPTQEQAAALASPMFMPRLVRPYTPSPDEPAVVQTIREAGRTVAELPTGMTTPEMLPLLPLSLVPVPGGPALGRILPKVMGGAATTLRHVIPKAMGILFGGQSLGHGTADIVTGIEQEDPGLVGRGIGETLIGGTMVVPSVVSARSPAVVLPRTMAEAMKEVPEIESPPATAEPSLKPGEAIVPTPTPEQPTEVPRAISEPQAAKIYEPLPSQSREGEQAVPIEEGGVRVPTPEKEAGEIPLAPVEQATAPSPPSATATPTTPARERVVYKSQKFGDMPFVKIGGQWYNEVRGKPIDPPLDPVKGAILIRRLDEQLRNEVPPPPQEPPASGPGAASPKGFFPQRSEAHGLGEPSMPPTVEDVRRQRLLDQEGTPVPPSPETPTPPPAGPPETTLDLPGDAEIANAIRRQDVMPGRDWLASPEFEFRKNAVGADLTTKAVEAELRYQAEAGRDYERFDKLKADLTKDQQIRITKALRAAQEGDRTGLARLTDQERGVATEIRRYFDEVKQVIIEAKRNDLIESMTEARGKAVRDILSGISEADAFRTHRLRAAGQRAVRDALAELERLNNWGPQDYVTNIERGSYRIVDPAGKTVAIAETRTAAKEKALAYSREHPDVRRLTITDEFATNVEFPTKLSRGQYFRMANRAANALGTDVREIQRMLRAEGSPVVIVKPASKFSGPLQRRYDVLKGEENLFDALPAYSYSIRKKLALDPVFKEARTDLAKLPENMRMQVEELLGDIRGRYSLADQITDYILSPLGQKPFMFSRGVNQARKITTALKLGYRPTTAIINRLGGAQHTWVKTGTKYWLEGRRFTKTPEFRELWKENADYVGASAQAFLEGGHTSVEPWYKPLGLFQRAELKNRPEAFASFYKYAEGELGLTGADAAAFARKASRFAQFTYTVGSLPRLLRNPVGRLVGQFKPYLVKEMEFISSLRGYEIPRYLTSFLAMGGPRAGIFMLRSLPILGAIGALWSVEDWLNRKAPRASRGVPGFAGVDVTAAVTPQLPSRATDWMGPTLSDMWHLWDDVIRPAMQGEHKDFSDLKDWGSRISPAALYWSRLVEAVASREGWITDARGRPEYKPVAGGKVALALGAKPLEQAVKEVDRAYLRHVDEIARKNREHVIDRILVALDKGDGASLSKLMQEAAEYGVDSNAIKNAAKQKGREPDERLRRQLLKSTRVIEAERAAP